MSRRPTRRELLKAAAAVPLAAVATQVGTAARATAREPAGASAAIAGASLLRPEHVLADLRFAETSPLVEAASRFDLRVHDVHDDLTALWNAELARAWRTAPRTLAGITTLGALFVLETLAADHGMRVVYRGTHEPHAHTPVGHGRCTHHFAGPTAALGGWLAAWRRGDVTAPWEAVTSTLLALPRCAQPAAHTVVQTDASKLDSRHEPIVSWVIAPRGASALAV